MKTLLLIPVFLLFMSAVPAPIRHNPVQEEKPVNKIDSINIKWAGVESLIKTT